METKIKIIDENECEVTFTGRILITRDTKDAFERELQELIDQYAI